MTFAVSHFLVYMNHVRRILFLFLACASLIQAQAQTIVNTETLLLDADEAFQWTTGMAGDFSNGNSNVVDLSLNAGVAWRRGLWTLKGAAAWARLAQDGINIQANAFGQLRIAVGDARVAQPFAFVQTSSNNVLLLNQRNLAGLGVKRRMHDGESLFIETSIGSFWEAETYTDESGEPPKELIRNSVILSAGWRISEHLFWRLTTYAQSAYSNFSDSRVFVECSMDVTLASNVAFEWNAGFRWDGDPHGGLGSWDLGNRVGLRLGLNKAK